MGMGSATLAGMSSKSSFRERRAGAFVPVFALRRSGDMGIGDTAAVRMMTDWCAGSGCSVLQLLPVNETSPDHSPYNAISSCALEPSLLEMSPEAVPGLDAGDLPPPPAGSGPVRYGEVIALKRRLLETAHARLSASGAHPDFAAFRRHEAGWLEDYNLFRLLMEKCEGSPVWEQWPEEWRTAVRARQWLNSLDTDARAAAALRMDFYAYVQWVAFRQWEETRRHADARGVALMGDIPFGVSRYSADVWACPDQFDLAWCGGAPPEPMFQNDAFVSQWGQNWGIPLYRWDRMEEDNFAWWRRRVAQTARVFRMFRIDHVLGFYRIYSFPWMPWENNEYVGMEKEAVLERAGALPGFLPRDDENEENRESNRAEGEKLLRMVMEAAGESGVVAEDLGVVPVYVRPSLQSLNIPGFKIPLFERDEATREFLPTAEYPECSLATLSTHDHETMAGVWEGWWGEIERCLGPGVAPVNGEGLDDAALQASWDIYRTLRLAGLPDDRLRRQYEPEVREMLMRRLLECPSRLVVLTLPDIFGVRTRFNVPGPVSDSNWSERMPFMLEEMADPDSHWGGIGVWLNNEVERAGRLLP